MKTSRLFLTVFLVFAFQTIIVHSQVKPEIGDKYEARYKMEVAGEFAQKGERIEYETERDTVLEITVAGVEDGLYELLIETVSIQYTYRQQGQEIKFDSTNEADLNNPQWTELKEEVSTPGVAKMDSKGILLDSNGTFGLQTFGGKTGMFFVIPEDLFVGKSWSDKTDSDGVKSEITYTVSELTETKAILNIQGTVNMFQTTETDGVEVITRPVSTFTGTTEIERSTYLILESNALLHMDVTVETKGEKTTTPATSRFKATYRKL